MKPTPKQRIWMYETMLKSRLFDDAVFEAYWEGKKPVFHMGKGSLPGEMHQSFGQEPTPLESSRILAGRCRRRWPQAAPCRDRARCGSEADGCRALRQEDRAVRRPRRPHALV